MNKFKLLVMCGVFGLMVGCAKGNNGLPYEAWRLGLGAPDYMEVWIETADAVDVRDRVFKRAMSGVAAINTPKNLKGHTRGWPSYPGWGAGKYVYGAAVPRLIYVRWQSLVEPQTYEVYIVIPEAIQQAMIRPEKAFCAFDAKWITGYRKGVTVGLAPGGIAKVWISGPCVSPIEVARVQGEVVKEGPSGGQTNGKYALPLEPETKAYIEKYGVPYGSW